MSYAKSVEEMRKQLTVWMDCSRKEIDALSDVMVQHYYSCFYYGGR